MKNIFNSIFIFGILIMVSCSSKEIKTETKDTLEKAEKSEEPPLSGPFFINVDSLKQTSLSPYASASIRKNENVIYSGGVSIAWKELKTICAQKNINLIDGPNWLSKLNNDPLTKNDIDSKSLTVFAGPAEEVVDSLEKISGRKLADSLRAHALVVAVKIFKKLDFPKEIQSSKDGGLSDFSFLNKKVEHNFIYASDAENASVYKIYNYKSDKEFIIKMPVENDSSELFMAKISPKASLQETYEYVMSCTKEKSKSDFTGKDKLAFPTIQFDLVKYYNELAKPIAGTDLNIVSFEQYLKFSLTNKGVVLIDSVYVVADSTFGTPAKEVPPKFLYFNSPFFIILKEKNNKNPYFLMWVGNRELMKEEK